MSGYDVTNTLVRSHVYSQFRRWKLSYPTPDIFKHLANLLGYESIGELQINQNEHDEYLMGLLAGPHGFVIYQMLLRKRNMKMPPTDKAGGSEVDLV